jgi:hypothetical protein
MLDRRYPYSGATEQPTPAFARGVRALADEHGALVVLDEIRTNFRVGSGVAPGHWCETAPTSNDHLLVAPDMCVVTTFPPLIAFDGDAVVNVGRALLYLNLARRPVYQQSTQPVRPSACHPRPGCQPNRKRVCMHAVRLCSTMSHEHRDTQ